MGCVNSQQVKSSTVLPDHKDSKKDVQNDKKMAVRFDDDLDENDLNPDGEKKTAIAKIIENSMSGIVNLTIQANQCDNPSSKKFYRDNQIFISQPTNMEIEISAPGFTIFLLQSQQFPLRTICENFQQAENKIKTKSCGVEGFVVAIVGHGEAQVTVSGCGKPILAVAEIAK